MAILNFVDTEGNALPSLPSLNGDEIDGPVIVVVVCEPGLCIDVTSEDELRFVPPPPPPVIERVEVKTVEMGTAGDEVELSLNSDAAALERLEQHLAELRGDDDDEVDEDKQAVRALSGRRRDKFYDW